MQKLLPLTDEACVKILTEEMEKKSVPIHAIKNIAVILRVVCDFS